MIHVFDGHSDILTDVTIRRLRGEDHVIERLHLDRLRRGGTKGAIFVIWVDPPFERNPAERTAEIMRCAAEEFKEASGFCVVRNYQEMLDAVERGEFYIFLGIEGLAAIGSDVDRIDMYYDFGCRHAMLSWNEENALATGVRGNPDRGLTEAGRRAVRRIFDKKMIMDVSHLNEKSFWDAAGCASGPVAASHSNAMSLCRAARNLTDEQLKEIGRSGGIVGVNAYPGFVDERPDFRTVERLAEHAAYIADLIGIEHVGCGFDFIEFLERGPVSSSTDESKDQLRGLEDSSKVQEFFSQLRAKGMTGEELEMVAYKNWHRLIENATR